MVNLFKNKKREIKNNDPTFEEQAVSSCKIELNQFPEIQRQINMIRLTVEDLAALQRLQPYVATFLDKAVNQFYAAIEQEPSLLKIIDQYSSIDRLKVTLRRHLHDLFKGQIDADYLHQRKTIARIHEKIGLHGKWYMAAFESLFSEFSYYIEALEGISLSEKMASVRAFHKVLNFEQQLVLEAFEEVHAQHRAEIDEMKQQVKEKVIETVQDLAAVSEQASASIDQLATEAASIEAFTSNSLSFVADTEQRSRAGQDIVEEQTQQVAIMRESIQALEVKMEQLKSSSIQIQEVVELVTSIANQTNLLALNAAIEAARAGQHGKGFAVVAAEVRKLSEDTKEAISSVTEQIQATSNGIEEMRASVSEMAELIRLNADSNANVSASFHDIVTSMAGIKQQSEKSNAEITSTARILSEVSHAIESLAQASDDLMSTAEQL